MHVAVLGAGIVGVSTAYFLAHEGHEVEVIDGAAEVATYASAGNAGFIAPNDCFAWASPTAPVQLIRSLLGEPTGLRVRLSTDPAMYQWGLHFLRECTPKRAYANSVEQMRLARYSVALQEELEATERIEYSVTRRGALYLYRDSHKLDKAAQRIPMFESHGLEQSVVTTEEIGLIDPGLATAANLFVGGIFGASDASGDCRSFTRALAERCIDMGVHFSLGTRVKSLKSDGDRIVSVSTTAGEQQADQYVLSLGVGSAAVARTVNEKLPIQPFKGYSATFPILEPELAPSIPAVEQTSLIAWSRMGERVRMSSTAEMSSLDFSWKRKNFASILRMVNEVFPKGVDTERGEFRACLRPMTPNGPPIIGYGRYSNLLYNTGHGHLGWTMGLGTGRITADLALGRSPEVQPPRRWLRQ